MKSIIYIVLVVGLVGISYPLKTEALSPQDPEKNVQDTIKVVYHDTTKVERPADTIYLEQKKMMNKLDSLINKQKK